MTYRLAHSYKHTEVDWKGKEGGETLRYYVPLSSLARLLSPLGQTGYIILKLCNVAP